ncbi:MAG: GspH/FimT family pseudopilin [Betaproteobacteria bacterium]
MLGPAVRGTLSRRRPARAHRSIARNAGFTMVELVVVLILVGILAVVAIPRLVGIGSYDTLGFYDRVASGLRYAQKQAIAKRRVVCATFAAASVTFTYEPTAGGGCTANLAGPNGQSPYTVVPQGSGVAFTATPANFSFDALGRPSSAQTISITGDGVRTLTVEPDTGYVRTS